MYIDKSQNEFMNIKKRRLNYEYSLSFSCYPSKITNEIYQGNLESAKDKDYLISIGITHILILGDLGIFHKNAFTYKKIIVNDTLDENIYDYFQSAYEFIEECIYNKGKVLIHCAAGISRSSAFTLCYLIKKDKLSYKNAMAILIEKRPCSNPNKNFRKQLKKWEKVNLSIS